MLKKVGIDGLACIASKGRYLQVCPRTLRIVDVFTGMKHLRVAGFTEGGASAVVLGRTNLHKGYRFIRVSDTQVSDASALAQYLRTGCRWIKAVV